VRQKGAVSRRALRGALPAKKQSRGVAPREAMSCRLPAPLRFKRVPSLRRFSVAAEVLRSDAPPWCSSAGSSRGCSKVAQ